MNKSPKYRTKCKNTLTFSHSFNVLPLLWFGFGLFIELPAFLMESYIDDNIKTFRIIIYTIYILRQIKIHLNANFECHSDMKQSCFFFLIWHILEIISVYVFVRNYYYIKLQITNYIPCHSSVSSSKI